MKKEIGHLNSKQGHWLISKPVDLLVLLLPVWALWLVFFSNTTFFQNIQLPLWAWVVFILGVDVGHVWSSLFRTYLDPEEFKTHKKLLILTPIILFVASVTVLSFSMLWFWRLMAYVAVFHFIKQQFGFVALYKLKAGEKRKQLLSDKRIIYLATLYPVVYWHFNSDASFNWFMGNDFFQLHALFKNQVAVQTIFEILNWGYWGLIAIWLSFEIKAILKGERVSIGKILWVLTTALNWWFGIVYFNSDVIFSVSNVVAHGIPYVALIYFYNLKKKELMAQVNMKVIWRLRWIAILLFTIILAAIVEEYFWDMFVYREHHQFFETILPYNWNQTTTKWGLVFAVAILALPQQTHYIIDGFIWKMNAKNKFLKPIFKPKNES